ncbi:iron complex transport system permease protein [Mycoplasmoides fastidiosum]|uniref:Iron complex transport system permease protein n=1 Tax=Mycoplasmoides fastidiosum TaxID=92758 RepID=A0ABU0LYN3_9BACT|nr:iron chelate uptake ABC transporter family permease subunit [Mycoplasmoides fastidiosum]MDQ0513789.1 iron complex transport system permease protein [Mycoplasmoides fastidiosum]UUD37793.1 iron ABC transporter permease [Mycoplasmoides fastidiosum]
MNPLEQITTNKEPNLIQSHQFQTDIVKKQQDAKRKKSIIHFISITIIFGVILFFGLTLLRQGFNFSLQIFSLRIWQYLIAIFGGGSLGVAGLLLQKTTKNNLADVSILGIGSLNIIFITIYIFSFRNGDIRNQEIIRQVLPLITIGASILGTSIIYTLTKIGNNNLDKFIIVGIALQFLFEAISISILNPTISAAPGSTINFANSQIINFSLGKFPDINQLATSSRWRLTLIINFVVIVLIMGVIWVLRKKIDLIETSEKLGISYGVKVETLKLILYLLIALLAGIEAAILGTVALLGILAPNISKPLFGNQTKTNLFSTFIIGAIMVMLAAFVSVNLATDIPIGFLSTAIITPYFIFLILKRDRR